MKILFDTSIIVEIDRQNEKIVNILKKLVEKRHDLIISTITVAEILTGSYLRKDSKEAVLKAKEVLNQFLWVDYDSSVAEDTSKLLSNLIIERKEKSVDYPDIQIAATFLASNCDYLITFNKKDFLQFQNIKEKILDIYELEKKLFKENSK